MEINFECEHCGQHLAMDHTGLEEPFDCPTCAKPIIFKSSTKVSTFDAFTYNEKKLTADLPQSRLTTCRDCNGQISRRAPACPHCGAHQHFKTTTLSSCKYCNQLVSINAPACPHCGGILHVEQSQPQAQPDGCGSMIITWCAIIIVAILLFHSC